MRAIVRSTVALTAMLFLAVAAATPAWALGWTEKEFERRPLFAYPLPHGRDAVIGNLIMYRVTRGDTLLDVGRWFGLTAREISDANLNLDWWSPPPGRQILLPTEHILPDTPRKGIVLNIPEMRLYYYPLAPRRHRSRRHSRKVKSDSDSGTTRPASPLVYTFPVGLGRFDWKTPIAKFKVRLKTHNPTWVVPKSIYKEHLELYGEAQHVVKADDPENPLGHYRLKLTLPEYALHGTNVPWGVGMQVSHGCVRLYPEDIERLYHKVKVGTPGEFVYQPVKFGWRAGSLYVEVHSDLYGMYPGLWAHAVDVMKRRGLEKYVDPGRLEKAVERRSGVPTYVMPGPPPETAG